MNRKVVVEICVDSLRSAIAAEKGGADRIELCGNLMSGGTSPSLGLIQLVKEKIAIDISLMIRPRAGDFCYSDLEIEVMKRDIEIAKKTGVKGIVMGVLKPDGNIDIDNMRMLIDLARPLTVTFHRGFDMVRDSIESLDILIDLGVERVLTSGKENNAIDGMDLLKDLVSKAGGHIIIMAGSGINQDNVRDIILNTGVKEIHLSAKKKVDSMMEFRNNNINMGIDTRLSEYHNYFTCHKEVKAIIDKTTNLV